MDVPPADAAGPDSEQNIMISHGREGSFHELHLPGGSDHGHRILFHKRFLVKKGIQDKTLCCLQA
jgi:hypothetical protein